MEDSCLRINLQEFRTFKGDLYAKNLLQAGAGTMRPDIMSSEMTGGSVGGGGHTSESIMSSVAARITPLSSGGSVRDDLPPSPNCSSAT